MLTTCPECNHQVSDKAAFCPNCGLPFKQTRKYNSKAKKLPNGFGQITKLNGNLRKPYRAMVTVGKTEFGRPISRLLKPEAYFKTYNEAYAALLEYNRKPFDLSKSITMKELYGEWSSKHFEKISYKTQESYKNAWKYCSLIYDMPVTNIRIKHVKTCIEEGEATDRVGNIKKPTDNVKQNIKILISMILDYAKEYELVTDNCAKAFTIPSPKRLKHHKPYTDDEINIFWEHEGELVADFILIQCYSGWRPNELLDLRKENINLEEGYFVGGNKTDNGKNRTVPIHPKISKIVERLYKASDTDRLFDLNYNKFYYKCIPVFKKYGIDESHKLHDGRKHFITLAKKYKVDEYAIKYIVGHTIKDLTERVYTQREFDWLKEEMEKIE